MKRMLLFIVVAMMIGSLGFAGGPEEETGGGTGSAMAGDLIREKDLPHLFATPADYQAETGNSVDSYNEAPMLRARVDAGELPPVEQRLPDEPAVVEPLDSIGRYGGELQGPGTNPNNRAWDVLEMRLQKLLTFAPDYKTPIPNIAKHFELSDDMRTITIWLREGMKWSDGTPLSVDDVEFFYEDIISNSDLYPVPPGIWRPGGQFVEFERVDDYTFRWHFAEANPAFVIRLASEREEGGIRPKHYLSQFHIDYNPDADQLARDEGYDGWVQMFNAKHQPYTRTPFAASDQDPYQPTIEPYVYVETDSFGNKYYERNPYFFKVDVAGNQLPYTDGLRRILVEDLEVQDLKAIAGDYTHYGWGGLQNFTTYKENEATGGYTTVLVTYFRANELTLSFNVNHPDPVKREVFSDLRFRQAMSLAINREEINNLIYFGRGTPRQASPVPQDSYYEDWMGEYYADFDLDQANELLDEMGLNRRDADGFRIGPDGNTLLINMEQGVPEPAWQQTAELVAQYWNDVGVKTNLKMIQGGLFREKRTAGELDVPGWGYDVNEVNFRAGGTWRVIPPYGNGANEWEDWLSSSGNPDATPTGIEPPDHVKEQMELYNEWKTMTPDDPNYKDYGNRIFAAQVRNLYAIGTVGLVPQPLLLDNDLRNGPKEGELWSWTFRQWVQFLPEQFWLDE